MNGPLVLTTHPLHPNAHALLAQKADIRVASSTEPDALVNEARSANIVIVRAKIPERLLHEAHRLQALVRHGAGLDMIPVTLATELGILVANVPGVNARAVAEHALMVSLVLSRRFVAYTALARQGQWAAARSLAESGGEIYGKTVGIVGYGAVGRQIERVFSALGARVLIHSSSGSAPTPVAASLDQVLANSDIVILCCSLTADTQGLLNAKRIGLMRHGAFLVNVSRGAVIDDEALCAALDNGHLGGAALDVFVDQPLPADHPLWHARNAILTPHVAGLSLESMEAMSLGAVHEVVRILAGDLPVNLVNPDAVNKRRDRIQQP